MTIGKKKGRVKASTKPKAPVPFCWECSRQLYAGARMYREVEVDGITRFVHAACLREMERDAR